MSCPGHQSRFDRCCACGETVTCVMTHTCILCRNKVGKPTVLKQAVVPAGNDYDHMVTVVMRAYIEAYTDSKHLRAIYLHPKDLLDIWEVLKVRADEVGFMVYWPLGAMAVLPSKEVKERTVRLEWEE